VILKIVAITGFVLGLVGCAIPGHIPLTQENANKVKTVNARSVVIQDEVIARADPSNISAATGGGLIPALIDASITNTRQERLQKAMDAFYASIEDYDFRAEYSPRVISQLKTNFPLAVAEVTTTPRTLSNAEQVQLVQALKPGEAYLSLLTDYFLSTDLRSLNVSINASLWIKDQPMPVYKNRVSYQSTPLGAGLEDSAKAWAADNGKSFYEKLREGITETLHMLVLDLERNAPASQPAKVSVAYNHGAGNLNSLQGTLVEKHGDRNVIRAVNGTLYSVKP
jgi:hypothetical protein